MNSKKEDAGAYLESIRSAIEPKFAHMNETANDYWRFRDLLLDYEYNRKFNEYAYRSDRHVSGEREAYEDFGEKWQELEAQKEQYEKEYGSLQEAYLQKKLALLVDTDVMLNVARDFLKKWTGVSNPKDITSKGRSACGIPVKNLIWFGRNQAQHHLDSRGPAVEELCKMKKKMVDKISKEKHCQYAQDISIHFRPEDKISMSDEIVKILDWRNFQDFSKDLMKYVPDN
jgi:hypothetical protein